MQRAGAVRSGRQITETERAVEMNAHARISDDAWADEQVQAALRVLSDHHAREWEKHRQAREDRTRQRIADWLYHARCCDLRADEYLSNAAKFPHAHKDHHYYLRLANEQLAKAADARRY